MKILIATKNPNKIQGAKDAFSHFYKDFEIEGIAVSSDVSEMPINDEIYIGAKNRVKNLKKYCSENNIFADLYISVESGMTNQICDYMITNVAVIEDNEDLHSYGLSASYPVPNKYVDRIINDGLQSVADNLFSTHEIGKKQGAINMITKGVYNRQNLNEQAFLMALTKVINCDLWR